MSLPAQSDQLGLGWGADGDPFNFEAPSTSVNTTQLGYGVDGDPFNFAPVAGGGGGPLTLALTGNKSTGKVGTVSINGNSTLALSGNRSTSKVGTLHAAVSAAVSGNRSTSKVGTVVPSQVAPPALDTSASAQASRTNTGTVTLSTTKADDIIVFVTGAETTTGAPAVASVSSTSGLTWHKRSAVTSGLNDQEVWWAHAPAVLTSEVITVTYAQTFDDWAATAFAVSGCSTSAPFDSNVSLPAFDTTDGTTVHAFSVSGVSTNSATPFVFMAVAGAASIIMTPPSGFTLIDSQGNGGGTFFEYEGVAYEVFSGALNSQTITWGAATNVINGGSATVDALVPAVPGTNGLLGNRSTSKVGTVASSVTLGLAGNKATGRAGTIVAVAGPIIALTGNRSTSKVGTVAPGAAVALQGNKATGRAGAVTTGSDKAIGLTGNAASLHAGTVAPGGAVALQGNRATTRAGSIAGVAFATPMPGNRSTGIARSPATTVTTGITGAHATAHTGNVGATLSPALSGNRSAGNAGMVAPSAAIPLLGVQATGHAGDMAAVAAVMVGGNAAAGQAGGLGAGIALPLVGNQIIGNANDLFVEGTIRGVHSHTRLGAMKTQLTLALLGVHATGKVGRPRAGEGEGSVPVVTAAAHALCVPASNTFFVITDQPEFMCKLSADDTQTAT